MIEDKLNGMNDADKEKNIDKKLEAFENKYEKKIKGLDNQLKMMHKLVSEKDSLISSFEKQYEEIKLKLAKH